MLEILKKILNPLKLEIFKNFSKKQLNPEIFPTLSATTQTPLVRFTNGQRRSLNYDAASSMICESGIPDPAPKNPYKTPGYPKIFHTQK
jgi:hypothetical protein